jgi:hypothetical protein
MGAPISSDIDGTWIDPSGKKMWAVRPTLQRKSHDARVDRQGCDLPAFLAPFVVVGEGAAAK